MSAHPPPAVIQNSGPADFLRVGVPRHGQQPRYFICGKPVGEGVYYRALAEWLRRGGKDRCLQVLTGAV